MGFFSSSIPFTPAKDIPDLTDKVILITGGNTGLGKETILQLARHSPAKIYLAARSASKATEAINSLNNQLTVSVPIVHLPLDLSSLASVRTAATTVLSTTDRLDLVILNAGIMATPAALSPDGFDTQLATNHLGHFYLTLLLLPLLTSTAPSPRVISLSSEAYNLGPSSVSGITSPTLPQQSPWHRYGASKAANILFASELARRYPSLLSVSVHPGIIMTDLHTPGQKTFSAVGWFMKLAAPIISQDVAHGVYNTLWAASSKVGEGAGEVKSGGYYTPVGRRQAGNKWAGNKEAGRGLWEWSVEVIEKAGFEVEKSA